MSIVLASTSPYRKILLDKLGLDFSCESPDIEEYSLLNETAQQMAERLAIQKARAVASRHQNSLVIGSDQAACFANQIIGKPKTHENAVRQLLQFSGKTVIFYTGLCVINSQTMKQRSMIDSVEVTFRDLSIEQIDKYLKAEQPYDCAGSFKCEGLGISLFTSLHGKDPNTLVGLPLIDLCDLLDEFGRPVL
ncbi:Maf family protein [Aliiglaciecola litoralis]|uniref:7-methyl-GTP pyrophosphatase n=1 Tax=Aliiglaciecola litoralis TaxID=582857 RepID=A0ABP3WL59_9ALTE